MTAFAPVALPSQRRVHVPAPAWKKPTTSHKPLARELSLMRTNAVFRSIAWLPSAGVAEMPPPPPALSPTTLARVAFAEVSWSGEKPQAPTRSQSSRSVASILDSFRWE